MDDAAIMFDCVKWSCSRTQMMALDAAEWITPILLLNFNFGVDEIARRVRGKLTGTADAFEKGLTARGRSAGGVRAAQLVVENALSEFQRRKDAVEFASDPNWTLRFTAPLDSTTCISAKDFNGRLFTLAEVPSLPLAECRSEHCRCFYRQYSRIEG